MLAQPKDSLTVNNPIINDSLALANTKQEANDTVMKIKTKRPIFIGIDLYQPILTAFTDKTSGQAFVNVKIKNKWHLAAELGYESNTFEDLGWDIKAKGTFFRLGFNYFLSDDKTNPNNGFYTGFRLAYSPYKQAINQYVLRGTNSVGQEVNITQGPLPEASVSAFWLEPLGGARVKLFNTNFYADASVRLQVLVGGKQQNNIEPLVIPGYGKDVGGIQANLFWGVSYQF